MLVRQRSLTALPSRSPGFLICGRHEAPSPVTPTHENRVTGHYPRFKRGQRTPAGSGGVATDPPPPLPPLPPSLTRASIKATCSPDIQCNVEPMQGAGGRMRY